MSDAASATNAEARIASLFAQYEPAIAKLGKALRAKMRARLPGFSEIVYMYANQESLVIAYSPTERGGGSDALYSIAVKPDGVKLYFTKGVTLAKSDAHKLLQGSASTVRYVEMNSAADFERAEIQGLVAAALKLANLTLDPKAKGTIVLKMDEQKQRAKKAATKAVPRKTRSRR